MADVTLLGLAAIDAAAALGVSESQFHKLRRRPDFPRPRLITPRQPRWLVSELATWLESQPASAKAAEPKQLQRGRVFRSGQQEDA